MIYTDLRPKTTPEKIKDVFSTEKAAKVGEILGATALAGIAVMGPQIAESVSDHVSAVSSPHNEFASNIVTHIQSGAETPGTITQPSDIPENLVQHELDINDPLNHNIDK